MRDTVECPYCGYDNDMSDALCDGLSSDNTFDHECESCEEEFEVYVEFDPSYSASKIIYTKCDVCGEDSREVVYKGIIYPWTQQLHDKTVCRSCFHKSLSADLLGEVRE